MSQFNLASLAPAVNAATGLSNLIIAIPEDQGISPEYEVQAGQKPPEKFLFDFNGEQSITLKSDITDHFVEDNSSLQDHIGLPPENIRTHGFIGELKDFAPDAPEFIRDGRDKLIGVSSYAPAISVTMLVNYNRAFQVYQAAKLANSAVVSRWNSLSSAAPQVEGNAEFGATQNSQQKAFQKFYGYYKKRTLFKVQTPWAIFRHCAIEMMQFTQSGDTVNISDVECHFKPINYASSKIAIGNEILIGGQIMSADAAAENNLGSSSGAEVPYSQEDLFSGLIQQ
jgi:hypothetical protein